MAKIEEANKEIVRRLIEEAMNQGRLELVIRTSKLQPLPGRPL